MLHRIPNQLSALHHLIPCERCWQGQHRSSFAYIYWVALMAKELQSRHLMLCRTAAW